jgi:peptidoglycan L-alanyl-D-glutamate endopeptidase CwlK
MSDKLFPDDILFDQRLFSVAGFYTGPLNGKWSGSVDAAEAAFFDESGKIAKKIGTFDARSEGVIRTLLPDTQRAARNFLNRAKDKFSEYTVKLISGTRTYAEQDQLYKKGRFGNKEKKVTKARGGQSNHNFGIAWDVGIFREGKYLTGDTPKEDKVYKALAAAVLSNDLEWGGNWQTFVDKPHYQLKLDLDLSEIRARFEAGRPFT